MNKLWLLLKVQMRSTLGPRPRKEKKQIQPMQKLGRDGKPKKRAITARQKSSTGYTVLMSIAYAAVALVAFSFSFALAAMLTATGMLQLLPALVMVAASVMVLITTIYKTDGLLYGFKDYDLVMSLPIPTSTVIASRIIILYVYNLIFTALLMVPAMIVYAIFAQTGAGYWPVAILLMLATPLVPVILATIIGSLISWVASHFKRRQGATVVFTVIFFIVWMLFAMNMNSVVEEIAVHGEQIFRVVNQIYPLAGMYTAAVTGQSIGAFIGFMLISVGAFAAFALVVSRFFKRMNTALTTSRTVSNYKMTALSTAKPRAALLRKEFIRFFGSSTYVMNAGIGMILMVIAAVAAVIIGPAQLVSLAGMEVSGMEAAGFQSFFMQQLLAALPIGLGFFVVMTVPTASSISLEGNNFWIVKSMPVRSKDVLLAKLQMNWVLILAGTLISSTLINIAFKPGVIYGIFMYLTPLCYGLFMSTFGLSLNLGDPNFDWDTEVSVIKQGRPVMTVTLVGMAITIIPAIVAVTFGELVLYICTAATGVLGIILYVRLMTKGVEQYDALSA